MAHLIAPKLLVILTSPASTLKDPMKAAKKKRRIPARGGEKCIKNASPKAEYWSGSLMDSVTSQITFRSVVSFVRPIDQREISLASYSLTNCTVRIAAQ